jgi:hypothetical protein
LRGQGMLFNIIFLADIGTDIAFKKQLLLLTLVKTFSRIFIENIFIISVLEGYFLFHPQKDSEYTTFVCNVNTSGLQRLQLKMGTHFLTWV